MIDSDYTDDTLYALTFIDRHAAKFLVCGSRWTGSAHNSSDFDFIIDDPGLFDSVGWPPSKQKEEYRDQNTRRVSFKGRVHLILVGDIQLRREAYRIILRDGKNPKDSEVWRSVYDGLGLTREDGRANPDDMPFKTL